MIFKKENKIIKKKKNPLSIGEMVSINKDRINHAQEKIYVEKEKFINQYKNKILELANEAFNSCKYKCDYINVIIFGDPIKCEFYKRISNDTSFNDPNRIIDKAEIVSFDEEMYNCINFLGEFNIPSLLYEDEEERITVTDNVSDKKVIIKINLQIRVFDE